MRYLLILFFCSTVQSAFINVIFRYQSQGIPLNIWVDWFTLCLAPVIAHVAGGVVSSTIIGRTPRSPSWTATLPHFNPVSILWRYYAIADRRLRARSWDERDLAACNAVFFDSDKGRFDGSKEIMISSRAWIVKIPESKHTPLLSASLLTTILLTIQGIEATYLIVTNLLPAADQNSKFVPGLPYIFAPIGCLGFLRLPAAFWLSNNFGYLQIWQIPSSQGTLRPQERSEKVVATIESLPVNNYVEDRLHSPRSWRGVVFRTFWFLTVLLFMSVSAASAIEPLWGAPPSLPYISVSHLLLTALWVSVTLGTLLIHTFYISIGRTNSTIIPCIHATWYKIYTAIVILVAFTAFVISAMETRVMKSTLGTTDLPEFNCKTVMGGLTCVPVGIGQGNFNV
jgi:hypothetical protein